MSRIHEKGKLRAKVTSAALPIALCAEPPGSIHIERFTIRDHAEIDLQIKAALAAAKKRGNAGVAVLQLPVA